MSFGNFFDRAAVAASQILHGYEEATFKHHLEHSVVGIAFDESAAGSVEAKTTLSLTVNLLSRLYPRLLLKPRGENASGLLDSLITIAKSINPLIDFVHESEEPTFCISVGTSSPNTACPVIYIGSDGWLVQVSSNGPVGSGITQNPFGASAAACFAAANTFRFLFSNQLKRADLDSKVRVSLLDWEPSNDNPPNPRLDEVDLDEVHLIGVGAIGNAALWALARVEAFKGVLHLIDKEVVELSNLQRYVLTSQAHQNVSKVLMGAEFLKSSRLKVVAHQQSWGEYLASRNNWRLDRVAVAVDSANARREVQASLPRWIVNAWTQPGDIGISRHYFLEPQACLMCLYFPDGTQKSEDQLVAEAIGMTDAVLEIRNMLYMGTPLSGEFLNRIAVARRIDPNSLLRFANQPLRTLYVEGICGGALLEMDTNPGVQRMEVPMNFQSALAGVMLSAELVANAAGFKDHTFPVTTRIDMLKPLGSYLSLPAPNHPSGRCICQDPDYIAAYRVKYCNGKDCHWQKLHPL